MPSRRHNTESFTRAADDGRSWQHAAAHRGYLDAAAGLPFSDWYSLASKDAQLAYEIGRQWVTNMRAAGIEPPGWHAGPPPNAVLMANVLAAERGEAYATPWGVMPNTDDPVALEPLGIRIRGRKRRR
jgi:hypothetical protein